jgi:hypothetical protein
MKLFIHPSFLFTTFFSWYKCLLSSSRDSSRLGWVEGRTSADWEKCHSKLLRRWGQTILWVRWWWTMSAVCLEVISLRFKLCPCLVSWQTGHDPGPPGSWPVCQLTKHVSLVSPLTSSLDLKLPVWSPPPPCWSWKCWVNHKRRDYISQEAELYFGRLAAGDEWTY